jgi:hypothetical protein
MRQTSPRPWALALALGLAACSPAADDDDAATPAPPPRPCTSWAPAAPLGSIQDPELNEISGIVASRRNPGVLWVHEDSGDGPVITAVDRTGFTLGTVVLEDVDSVDHEDIALGACEGEDDWCLVLADFGDNTLQRDTVALRRIVEPLVTGLERPFEVTRQPEDLVYRYEDGPENAEALVLLPDGSPVVLSKRGDGLSRVHRLPADGWSDGGEVVAELVETLTIGTTGGLIDSVTAADLSRDGTQLLVRTYGSLRLYDLSETGLPGIADAPTREMLPGAELQGEAVAWDVGERDALHLAEAERPPIYRLECRSAP